MERPDTRSAPNPGDLVTINLPDVERSMRIHSPRLPGRITHLFLFGDAPGLGNVYGRLDVSEVGLVILRAIPPWNPAYGPDGMFRDEAIWLMSPRSELGWVDPKKLCIVDERAARMP